MSNAPSYSKGVNPLIEKNKIEVSGNEVNGVIDGKKFYKEFKTPEEAFDFAQEERGFYGYDNTVLVILDTRNKIENVQINTCSY